MKNTYWKRWRNPFLENFEGDDETKWSFIKEQFREEERNIVLNTDVPTFKVELLNDYNFWILLTTKKFTKKIYEDIINLDGVEGIHVVTPYRAKIAIAVLFEEKKVMNEIDKLFSNSDTNIFEDYWMLVSKNDNIRYISGNSKEEVLEKFKSVNGDFLVEKTSWE